VKNILIKMSDFRKPEAYKSLNSSSCLYSSEVETSVENLENIYDKTSMLNDFISTFRNFLKFD